jgi:hypothetical protein
MAVLAAVVQPWLNIPCSQFPVLKPKKEQTYTFQFSFLTSKIVWH